HTQPKPEPEPQGAGEAYDVEQAILMILESFQAQGQEHVGGVAIREPVAEVTRPLCVVEDAETGADTDKVISEWLNFGEEKGEDVDNKVYLEEQTVELDEGHAGSEPGVDRNNA
nr:hypothetical protein [Tanacetum cinerariifolium]